ncbi:hypothetical protein M3666_06920 [Curtobacterium sp. ODYSSEY 48 V2]|uniref:hypothetical protein n=1 Tax=Curtobacterium sp. ODYSSEY 48 V2 TaxID=2939561 RepID=UPI0020414964|nr:hypothetical protein [Curtobacterium sp. ODYSSEY 48 V2]MCM3504842.1 hypothetical protein [Curtobacterium sp. ODYSSEY 48 V2]
MARRARRGPLAGLLALAVVVSGLGAAWLVTGDDDVVRTARATDRASTAPDGAGPLGVSNALGAPVPGADRRPDVPRSVEDWVGRVLPVSGTVVPLVDGIAATVRIERIDESSVAVRIDDLSSPPGTRAVRLVLSPDAMPDRSTLAHAPGVVTASVDEHTSGGFSLITDGSSLQADTRSAALVDDETDEVLGVALLVPAD